MKEERSLRAGALRVSSGKKRKPADRKERPMEDKKRSGEAFLATIV